MLKAQAVTSFLVAGLLSAALFGCSGAAEGDDSASAVTVGSESAALKLPPISDAKLAPPAGNRLAFANDAIGVQIYSCQAAGSGFAFTFVAPEASLFDCNGKVVIKHFGGPTWQSVADGSSVVAKKVGELTDDPKSIAELLLQATTHGGNGIMSDVTFIQRLETVGGLAPTDGCDASQVGVVARVPYTATYFFYKAGRPVTTN
jgi:hypothetical protein